MTSPTGIKIEIRKNIKGLLEINDNLDYEKVVTNICLQTGFTEKTVRKIISQMEIIGDLKINGILIERVTTK